MNGRFFKRASALMLISGLSAVPALADTTATSTTTTEAAAPKFMDNLSASYALDFWGPAITDLNSSFTPDADTGAPSDSAIFTDHSVGVRYKLGNYRVGATAAGTIAAAREKSFTWYDPYAVVSNRSLYTNGGFNFGSEIRFYPGITTASQDNNMVLNVRWFQFTGYDVPDTNLSFNLTTYVRPYFYSDIKNPAKPSKIARFYVGPEVSYKILPNLNAWLLFEYIGQSRAGQGAFNLFTEVTDIEPGVTWDINSRVSLTPFLDIKTSGRTAADTTTLNASLSLKLL